MKNKKALIVGIVAAVVVLAALLCLLLVQCTGQGESAQPAATTQPQEAESCSIYYNMDKDLYAGKSEAGMSSRQIEDDGFFHVRFFLDGNEVDLKVADRKVVNTIDAMEIMGLEFDEEGIVVGVIPSEDMPLEVIGWRFFVQGAARTTLKLNSSEQFNGMEILLENIDPQHIWDMTGRSGPKGCVAEPIQYDRVLVVSDLEGNVTHVFLVERPYFMATHEGFCQHCDKNVTWNEWVRTDAAPLTAGHYQLMTDVQLTGQASMQEDAKICLDLNGHRLDGKEGSRLYSVHNPGGALAIMDTSEGQTGVIAAHGKTNAGGSCLWPRYGALYLYGGTVDASDVITTGNGAAGYVPKNSYFYMFGGTIKGGTADYTHNPDNNTYGAGCGGNVYVVGKFVMHDGLIQGGDAKGATYYNASGSKVISRGYGGNLYLGGAGEFEMNGGTIENGRAGSNGANIYVTSTATVTINDGAIKGGLIKGAGKNGGYIGGGACYLSATGKRNPDSLNYNLMVVNGRFDMYGGKIAGGVGITDSSATDKTRATVVLSGYATICDGPNGNNLYLSPSGEGVKVLVGTLYESAKIGVNTTVGLFTEPTQEKYLKNFTSDIKGADIVYHQERLGLGRLNCVCGKEPHTYGCDETVLMWAPWTKTNSLPTANGNYYLLNNVTTTDQTVVTGEKDVKLDLNGKTVTYQVQPSRADGFRLYRADQGAVLTLTDTTKKPGTLRTVMPGEDAVYPGKTTKSTVKDEDGNVVERIYYTEEEIRALWKKANSGMLLWARGGTIHVFAGIYDASNLTGASAGLAVLVNNRTITEDGKTDFYQGKLNFYGGTILGGYTKQSGQVAVYEKAQMNLYGGTIRDGRSYYGGNIYVAGTLDIYGGTVEGGVVDRSADAVDGGQGGNIAVDGTGVMNLHGGTVKDGYVRGGYPG